MTNILDHRLLRQIVAVARAGGLRAGAAALNMSQPPLSRTIRELEAAMGVSLFVRSANGMAPTAAGTVFLEEATEILATLDRAEHRVKRMGAQPNPLRIGFVSAALDAYLPDLLSRIADRGWPMPELIEQSTDPQARALAHAELDIGLLHPPIDVADGLTVAALGQDGFLIALPEGHRLGAHDTIHSADLKNLPLVLFPQAQGPVLHAAITKALAPNGNLRIGAEAARSHTQLALVAAGAGIGLIGASVAKTVNYRGVVFRHWADRPKAVALHCAIMGTKDLLSDLSYI